MLCLAISRQCVMFATIPLEEALILEFSMYMYMCVTCMCVCMLFVIVCSHLCDRPYV